MLSPLTTGCGPSDEPSTQDVQDAQEEVVDEVTEDGEADPGSGEGEYIPQKALRKRSQRDSPQGPLPLRFF